MSTRFACFALTILTFACEPIAAQEAGQVSPTLPRSSAAGQLAAEAVSRPSPRMLEAERPVAIGNATTVGQALPGTVGVEQTQNDNPFELTGPVYFAPPDLRDVARKVLAVTFMVVPACILIVVFANRRKRAVTQRGGMAVVETISLGPRCHCDLLSVRGQLFVLARDNSGIKGLQQVNQFHESLERFVTAETETENPLLAAAGGKWMDGKLPEGFDLGGREIG